MARILDIGSGWKHVPGAVRVDIRPQTNPHLCADLDVDRQKIRYFPFQDDTFDEIYALQVMNHFRNIVPVMEEIHRVAKPGALFVVTVAHVSSIYAWSDPVHYLHLTSRSFLCFTDHPTRGSAYTKALFRQRSARFIFGRSLISLIPRLICFFSPWIYEKHFCWMFPANDMRFEFEALK